MSWAVQYLGRKKLARPSVRTNYGGREIQGTGNPRLDRLPNSQDCYGAPLIFCLVVCSALSTSRAITLLGILRCPRQPEFTCQIAFTTSKRTRFVEGTESGMRISAPLLLGSVPAATNAPTSAF